MNKRSILAVIIFFCSAWASQGQTQRSAGSDAKSNPGDSSSLAGVWRLDLLQTGNVNLTTFFVIRKGDSAKYEGTVTINGAVDLPFRKIRFEGTELVFSPGWNRDYRLRVDGDRLHVTIVYAGGGSTQGFAVRVPIETTYPPKPIPVPAIAALSWNGLAKTPPMGWNSWNHFSDKVNDSIVRAAADRLVSSGLAASGYVYINIDDCWEGHRDGSGNMVPNDKFPDMKALADYVHSLGLKLGIYSSPGPLTCGGYLGSFGYEQQDADRFAAWGIDYLKYDWCSASRVYTNDQLQAAYQKMGAALAGCGRPIVFSFCEYGMNEVWKWGPQAGANLWRTTGDIQDNWQSMSRIGFSQSRLSAYAGPGHWNDPDMLEVGNGGMTDMEYRTHFSLWCLLAAPLIAGNDLNQMSPRTLAILNNKEAIAIDQDPLGKPALQLVNEGDIQIWARELGDGSRAVGLFNTGSAAKTAVLDFSVVKIKGPAQIRDCWLHQDAGSFSKQYSATVEPHGVILIRITAKNGSL